LQHALLATTQLSVVVFCSSFALFRVKSGKKAGKKLEKAAEKHKS